MGAAIADYQAKCVADINEKKKSLVSTMIARPWGGSMAKLDNNGGTDQPELRILDIDLLAFRAVVAGGAVPGCSAGIAMILQRRRTSLSVARAPPRLAHQRCQPPVFGQKAEAH